MGSNSDLCKADAMTADPQPHRYESTKAWREVDDYFAGALVQEDEALTAARQSSSRTTMPNAEVAPPQGALLGLIAQMIGARRVLEFGTLAGQRSGSLGPSAPPAPSPPSNSRSRTPPLPAPTSLGPASAIA